jgi:uncharacterized membrane protein YgdD (TMEM256/DUF423 family)
MTPRLALFLAAVSLFVAVAAGAFGAHAGVPPGLMPTYQTAVQYHFWHALGLLGISGLLLSKPESRALKATAWLLIVGIVLFSGSLYARTLTGVPAFGYATPMGGAAFLAAWATLAWAALRW